MNKLLNQEATLLSDQDKPKVDPELKRKVREIVLEVLDSELDESYSCFWLRVRALEGNAVNLVAPVAAELMAGRINQADVLIKVMILLQSVGYHSGVQTVLTFQMSDEVS